MAKCQRQVVTNWFRVSIDTSYWYAKKVLGHIYRQLDQDV